MVQKKGIQARMISASESIRLLPALPTFLAVTGPSQAAGAGRARSRPGAAAQGIKLCYGVKHSGNNGYLAVLLQ